MTIEVTLKDAKQIIMDLVSMEGGKPSMPVMVWGTFGVGKTDTVRQIAREYGYRCLVLTLSQYDSSDIKGIPMVAEGRVVWTPGGGLPMTKRIVVNGEAGNHTVDFNNPDVTGVAVKVYTTDGDVEWYGHSWKKSSNLVDVRKMGEGRFEVAVNSSKVREIVVEDKCLVFCDELSNADPTVQNAALQLILDRKVGDYALPESAIILGAGNRADGDGAFAMEFSAPLRNRFMHLTVVPDIDSFLEYGAATGIDPAILGFLKNNPANLHAYKEDSDPYEGVATPRSWEKLSQQMAVFKKASGIMRTVVASGFVGKSIASQFVNFVENWEKLPTIEEIVEGTANPLGTDVKRGQHFALAFAAIGYIIYRLENGEKVDEETGKIFEYFDANIHSEIVSWWINFLVTAAKQRKDLRASIVNIMLNTEILNSDTYKDFIKTIEKYSR